MAGTLRLGLGRGQAGVGTELALTVNKNPVPCTLWSWCFPARQGGCRVEKGDGGSLQGQLEGWRWKGSSMLWPFSAGSLWMEAGGFESQVPLSP